MLCCCARKLEDLEVGIADFMKKTPCASFKDEWTALGDEYELVEIFSLSTMKTIKGKYILSVVQRERERERVAGGRESYKPLLARVSLQL